MNDLVESPAPDSRVLLGWESSESYPIGFQKRKPASGLTPIWSNEEGHLMTIAPTGQGKGRCVIIPTLLRWRHQAIVIDPKGEVAKVTARQRSYFGEVVIIDPFGLVTKESDCLNPFDIKYFDAADIADVAMMLTDILGGSIQGLREPYWEIMGRSLLGGVMAYAMEKATKENKQTHLGEVREQFSSGDFIYSLAHALDLGIDNDFAREELAQFLNVSAETTRGGIASTAQQHLKTFGDASARSSLSKTTFSLEDLYNGKPMTIYLVLPPNRLGSHAKLLRLWIATLLHVLSTRRKRPKYPCLFLLDEAAQLGELEQLRTAMTLMRGYGVKVWTFWQDVSQLKRLYKQDWETIVNNAAAVQTFGTPNYVYAQQMASLIGNVSPETLLHLSNGEQVIMQMGGVVKKAKKLDYLQDLRYQGRYDPNPMHD